MRKTLLAGASVLAVALNIVPAHADPLTISATQTTPVKTSAAANGTPGDITINSSGGVTPSSGVAVTVDSNNNVSNAGTITITGADNSAGIQAASGVSGNITNTGTITVSESYTRTDTNSDGVLDGAYAQGSNRFGIQALGDLTGTVNNSGTITVQGNNSAGIAIGGTLNGSLSQTGTIGVTGDNGVGVRTGAVTGNVAIGGTITSFGTNNSGVILDGDIGGALSVTSTIATTGYSSTTLPASVSSLTADNLKQGGPAFWIQGNVAGGANFAAAVTTTNSDNTTTTTPGAAITSYGSAPGLQVGTASTPVTLGPVASDSSGYGLLIGGTIAGTGVYDGFSATGVQIGGLGGTVSIANGMRVTGSVSATSNGAAATALRFGSGASTLALFNSGTIGATISAIGSATNPAITAIQIDSGASMPTLLNNGTISATGVSGTTTGAIVDRSGTLATIHNDGVISATGGTTNVAIDVSASTNGVAIAQDTSTGGFAIPSITGDIRFGQGSNSLTVSAGSVIGNVSFGGHDNSMSISNGAAYTGNVDFGGATGALTISGSSTSFVGGLLNGQNAAVALNGSTLALSAGVTNTVGSFAMNGGTLTISVDGTTGATALLNVAGNASFAAGSTVNLQFNSLNTAVGSFTVVQAGSVTGGDNLSLTGTSVPYLFNRTIGTNATDTAVVITTARKTASELGLNRVLSTVYDPAYQAALGDKAIGDSFLALTDAAGVTSTLQAMLPNFSGGVFDTISLATRGTERAFADRNLQTIETGKWGAWTQLVGWTDNKGIGDTQGYRAYGGGLAGGVERSFGNFGRLGVSFSYLLGVSDDVGSDAGVNDNEALFNLYWRATWGRLHVYATGGYGTADFTGRRFFNGISGGSTFTRTATGKWGGTVYTGAAGVSYEVPAGRFYLRPEASIDYIRLKENGYAETGGGTGFDLTVDGRSSNETGINGSLVVGYYLSRPKDDESGYFRLEAHGGDRELVSSTLGATTARFAGGSDFTLTPEDRRSGWTGGLRLSAGNGIFAVTGDFGAEKQQNHVAATARLGVSFRL